MSESFLGPRRQRCDYDLVGIENAILDVLVRVEDRQIEELGLVKGTMKLVGTDEQEHILQTVGALDQEVEAGGSCSNVLRVASRLGCRSCYSSAVGSDRYGREFKAGLERASVADRVATVDGVTGTSVILVSPDGERTMNTHLGACRDYEPRHVPTDAIESAAIFFTTAYIWDTPNQIEAIELGLATARRQGAKVALDLADPFAVERSRDILHEQLRSGVHVLFANTEEARMMTGEAPAEAAAELAREIEVVVVTDGANGAFVASGESELHVPARRVEVVDTTGAGDCFAAGFLHGLVHDYPLRACAELATLLAADTIQRMGVRLSDDIEARVAAVLASTAS